jgi:single-stranded-DNA-specific exonuclease
MTLAISLDLDDTFENITSSLLGHRWRHAPCDERLLAALIRTHELPEIAARILASRGIGLDEAPMFLAPSLKTQLPDPNCLQDMEAAALRLARAIEGGEQIAIFADYDVDGATSAALWLRYLQAVGAHPWLYVPDRIEEGYGPNAPALLALKTRGAKLVVTVDCGVVAHEPLTAARDAGLDVVVIDHHMAEASLPPAAAIINPNRLDDTSGLGHLAAVGVSFVALVGVTRVLRQRGWFQRRPEPNLLDWLDLVALGTVCDVVPLTGLNRAFVAQGLRVMANRQNIGLAALADVARLAERPSTYHLGFVLGPRINAGGRIGKADLGARLLSTTSASEALIIAEELDQLNAERRRLEVGITEEAMRQAEAAGDEPVLLIAGEGWHPGVIGIVASRIAEKFRRPTCVVALENGIGKASCRSRPGIDLGGLIIAARQAGILVKGGGHAMAAGFTIEAEKLDELRAFFAANAALLDARPQLQIEAALAVSGATLDVVRHLERLGPYGAGHKEPLLALLNCQIYGASVVGETHVRCQIGANGVRLKGIAFRALEHALGPALLQAGGQSYHLAGRLGIDTWQGREEVKFEITDAAPIRQYPDNCAQGMRGN